MFRSLLATILFLSTVIPGLAQYRGSVVGNDEERTRGYIQVDWVKPPVVRFYQTRNSAPQILSPEDILEFGYDNRVFRSVSVRYPDNSEKYEFAEQLISGEVQLYRTIESKTYFFKGEELAQLSEENLAEEVNKVALKCRKWDEQYPLVKLNNGSLTTFVTNINHRKCKNIPFLNFGLQIGYSRSEMNIFRESFALNRVGDISLEKQFFSAGAFIEWPLYRANGWSFMNQVSVTQRKFENTGSRQLTVDPLTGSFIGITQFLNIEHTSVGLEFGPKFTFNTHKLRPYLNGNAVFEVLMFQQNDMIHQTVQTDGSTSFREEPGIVPISNLQYGISYAGGIQYFFKMDRYVALELKSAMVFDAKLTRKIDRINNLNVLLRLNL